MSRNFQPPSRHNIIAQLFVQCRNIMSGMQHLTWSDPTELLPALLTIIMVLLSFSIANGIAAGFLSCVLLKVIAGKTSDVSAAAWVMSLIFSARLAFF